MRYSVKFVAVVDCDEGLISRLVLSEQKQLEGRGWMGVRATTEEAWMVEAREELKSLPAMQPYRPVVAEHVASARRSKGARPNA